MRAQQRRRRQLPPWTLIALAPLFRYDFARDAYVLRLIGNRVGPVLRARASRRARG